MSTRANHQSSTLPVHQHLLWALISQTILSIGAVAITVTLSALLDKELFGSTRYLLAVLATLAFFSLPGMVPVLLKRMQATTQRDLRSMIAVQLRWGLGATVGAVLFSVYHISAGEYDLALAFIAAGVIAPVANLYLIPGTVLAGLTRYRAKTFVDGSILVAATLGATIGAVFTGSIAGTIFVYLGSQALATIAFLWFVTQKTTGNTTVAEPVYVDTQYGKHLTIFQIPFVLLPAVEKMLVFFLLGPVPLAIFAIATLPTEHVRNAYRSLLQFLVLPQLSGTSVAAYRRLRTYTLLIALAGWCVLVLFALILMPFLFPKYTDAIPLTLLLGTSLALLPVYFFVLVLVAEKKRRELFQYVSTLSLVSVVLLFTLAPTFGIAGAIAAKVIAETIAAGAFFLLYRRRQFSGRLH